MKKISRRNFILNGTMATLGLGALNLSVKASPVNQKSVKIAIIGTGMRGTDLLSNLLTIDYADIVAVCDLVRQKAENVAATCENAGKKRPKIYCKDENTWKELLDKESLDAVIIATYWDSHAPMALYAMQNGVCPGIEVPCALTVENCWRLVETSEKTGIHCMMLENWSFRKDNLALLNMVRLGMLGEIVHSHCAHSHDCIDHWFFDSKTGEQKWPARYLLEYNRDQYPTHSVGPVLSWLDINCGDVITEIYSIASASKGINSYFKRRFGENHPNANLIYKQGDIVTSLLRTKNGKTFVVNYDMQLPRPYSNRWMLQGTNGIYDEEKSSVYLVEKSPEYHQWEPWKPYENKYNHKWWQDDLKIQTHGGTDFVMLREFVKALAMKAPTPIDVYDSVAMSAIIELSGISIAQNKPVEFPDFTKGKWKIKKPYFALDQVKL